MKKWLMGLAGILCAATAQGEVVVQGEGKVTAQPDTAYVSVGVETTAKTAYEALTANNQAVQQLFTTLEKFGIKKEHIQTSDFTISAQYDYGKPNSTPKLIGYNVSNQVTVCTSDLKGLGEMLDAVVKAGANRVTGIRFAVKDTQKLMDEARQAAMKDAVRRAQLYADAGGFKLGKVLVVQETQRIVPRMYSAAAARADSAPAVPVSGGELSYSVTINVSFDIVGSEAPRKKHRK